MARTTHQAVQRDVVLHAGTLTLEGMLWIPEGARSLVIFAHGSGSSRFSSRNQMVARFLNDAAIGTLLFDLLTAEENRLDQHTAELRFDIPLLARRTTGAVDWALQEEDTRDLPIGLFGASTGAAAALIAAAQRPQAVHAVVSRGGRPDLAGTALAYVQAPTLLMVGSLDTPVIRMNQDASQEMQCERHVEIVQGASHLFEEPGKLQQVARLAIDWFQRHLPEEGRA